MYRAFPPRLCASNPGRQAPNPRVHALDERPVVRHCRVSLGDLPGARDFITFPGYVFGPAGIVRLCVLYVLHLRVAVLCDAEIRFFKIKMVEGAAIPRLPSKRMMLRSRRIHERARISSIRPKRVRDSLVFSLSQEKDKYLIARSPACA